MESDFVAPEELATRFRSKRDLYTVLTVDCKNLPTIHEFSGVISTFL